MEQNDSLVTDQKDHASRPTAGKVRTKLVKPRSKRPNERHTNGPTIFETLKIATEHAPVLLDQAEQPLADRLVTRVTSEEDSGEPLEIR